MTMRYFSDPSTGRHVCATDGADRPGLIETVGPPPSPAHRWGGSAWATDAPITVDELVAAIEKGGAVTKAGIIAGRRK